MNTDPSRAFIVWHVIFGLLLVVPSCGRGTESAGFSGEQVGEAATSEGEESVGRVDQAAVKEGAGDGDSNETASQDSGDPSNGGQEQSQGKHFEWRNQMVEEQLISRDIVNERVLKAMRKVPRHEFVPAEMRERAYYDGALPIGEGQTISQPYIVALMTQAVDPQPGDKVLDVGTGSGYQAAILAELVEEVYGIEIIESLAKEASERLERLGYENVQVRHGDGYHGWESEAPFDAIIVAAAPDHVPPKLVEQLAPGGKIALPVGDRFQTLMVVEKDQDGKVKQKEIAPVAFVPMTGSAEDKHD